MIDIDIQDLQNWAKLITTYIWNDSSKLISVNQLEMLM